MRNKQFMSCALAIGMSALSAHAWSVSGTVSCLSGRADLGATVTVTQGSTVIGTDTVDGSGAYSIDLPDSAGNFKICLDTSTSTDLLTVKGSGCQTFKTSDAYQDVIVNFTVNGPSCGCVIAPACWLTGGGTIDDSSASPHYSFGGVVYPGCSPRAAGGGNWNVVDHLGGYHFKGLDIIVDSCSGAPDAAPPVNVNIIDFHGTGILVGIDGNTTPLTLVSFVGHAEDHGEPGAGVDILSIYVSALDGSFSGTKGFGPVAISTGNLQIHTSGCAKD